MNVNKMALEETVLAAQVNHSCRLEVYQQQVFQENLSRRVMETIRAMPAQTSPELIRM